MSMLLLSDIEKIALIDELHDKFKCSDFRLCDDPKHPKESSFIRHELDIHAFNLGSQRFKSWISSYNDKALSNKLLETAVTFDDPEPYIHYLKLAFGELTPATLQFVTIHEAFFSENHIVMKPSEYAHVLIEELDESTKKRILSCIESLKQYDDDDEAITEIHYAEESLHETVCDILTQDIDFSSLADYVWNIVCNIWSKETVNAYYLKKGFDKMTTDQRLTHLRSSDYIYGEEYGFTDMFPELEDTTLCCVFRDVYDQFEYTLVDLVLNSIH